MKKALLSLALIAILTAASCSVKTDTEHSTVPETLAETMVSEATTETTVVTETETEPLTETTVPATETTAITTTAVPTTATTTQPLITTTIPQFPKPYYDTSAAEELLKRTNEQRALHSLPPLTLSNSLCDAAKIRSYEISVLFSHMRPDGSSCDTVYTQDIGENIAYGQTSYDDVFSAWMNSADHRKNILKEDYTQMGAYCYVESDGIKYWAQLFII